MKNNDALVRTNTSAEVRSDKKVLLICTVGGSPEPILSSVLGNAPARLVLIFSEQTLKQAEAKDDVHTADGKIQKPLFKMLREMWNEFDPIKIKKITLPDHEDLESCLKSMKRDMEREYQEWRQIEGTKVVVDITGGTKAMSVALFAAAMQWDCEISYVGGNKRDKGGTGIVLTGHETSPRIKSNPLNTLGYRVLSDSVNYFNASNYEAALTLLKKEQNETVSDPVAKRELQSLWALCSVYHKWDLFDHQGAVIEMEKLITQVHNFVLKFNGALNPAAVFSVDNKRLMSLCSDGGELPVDGNAFVIDLISNAGRRMAVGRYDDAVARLYRACEAYGQWRLREHGIKRTKKVSIDMLPERLRPEMSKLADNSGRIDVALQNAYKILSAYQDSAATRFDKLGFSDTKCSPLNNRNDSILAHGFVPISKATANKLFESVLKLTETNTEDLFIFPKINI